MQAQIANRVARPVQQDQRRRCRFVAPHTRNRLIVVAHVGMRRRRGLVLEARALIVGMAWALIVMMVVPVTVSDLMVTHRVSAATEHDDPAGGAAGDQRVQERGKDRQSCRQG